MPRGRGWGSAEVWVHTPQPPPPSMWCLAQLQPTGVGLLDACCVSCAGLSGHAELGEVGSATQESHLLLVPGCLVLGAWRGKSWEASPQQVRD